MVARVTVTLPRDLLAEDIASHLPENQPYKVWVGVNDELVNEHASGNAAVVAEPQALQVWRQVRKSYGGLIRPELRDVFVLATEGGVRLSPTDEALQLRDADVIEVCRPLPWEANVWSEALAEVEAKVLPGSPAAEAPRAGEGKCRSSGRKSKKRKLLRLERLGRLNLLETRLSTTSEEPAGGEERPAAADPSAAERRQLALRDADPEPPADETYEGYCERAAASRTVAKGAATAAGDYSSMPKWEEGDPPPGRLSRIAYKVLEISGGVPVLSEYRMGLVRRVERETGRIVVAQVEGEDGGGRGWPESQLGDLSPMYNEDGTLGPFGPSDFAEVRVLGAGPGSGKSRNIAGGGGDALGPPRPGGSTLHLECKTYEEYVARGVELRGAARGGLDGGVSKRKSSAMAAATPGKGRGGMTKKARAKCLQYSVGATLRAIS